eukprot:1643424-Pyramimonas_sp.AAC.2
MRHRRYRSCLLVSTRVYSCLLVSARVDLVYSPPPRPIARSLLVSSPHIPLFPRPIMREAPALLASSWMLCLAQNLARASSLRASGGGCRRSTACSGYASAMNFATCSG